MQHRAHRLKEFEQGIAKTMVQINCPNCGDTISPHAGVRMLTCPSCGTTLMAQDDVVELAGEAGVMHDAPLLFGLGDQVTANGETFDILGHARFSYGRGWWDEFWALDGAGHPAWLSIDEGDVAIQRVIRDGGPGQRKLPYLGEKISHDRTEYVVNEIDDAECIAIRGEFDEPLNVGETYQFVNAISDKGTLLSGEIWEGGAIWFLGAWVDPFDVQVKRAQ